MRNALLMVVVLGVLCACSGRQGDPQKESAALIQMNPGADNLREAPRGAGVEVKPHADFLVLTPAQGDAKPGRANVVEDLVYLGTPAAALRVMDIQQELGRAGADVNRLLTEIRGLLPAAARTQFKNNADLDRIWAYLRLDNRPEHALTWLNLQVLERAIASKDARLPQMLTSFGPLIDAHLLLPPNKARDPQAIKSRIAQLRIFFHLLDGFHPVRGPSGVQVAETLRNAGLPELPTKGSAPVLRDGKHWDIDLEINIGLGQPLRIVAQPIGNVRGFLYGPNVAPVDLNAGLNEVVKAHPEVALSPTLKVRFERLMVQNRHLIADGSVTLPGSTDRLMIVGLKPTVNGTNVSWAWKNPFPLTIAGKPGLEIKIPASCRKNVDYDQFSGRLTVTRSLDAGALLDLADAFKNAPEQLRSAPRTLFEAVPHVAPMTPVVVAKIATEAVLVQLQAAADKDVQFDSVREVLGDRRAVTDAYTKAVGRLHSEMTSKPRGWLMETLRAPERAKPAKAAGLLEAVFRIGGTSVVIGPIAVDSEGAIHLPALTEVATVRTNQEVLHAYLASRLPLWPTLPGAASKSGLAIQGLELNPASGTLDVTVRWTTPLLDEPLVLALEIPTNPQGKFDGERAFRKALAGRTVQLGTMFSVQLTDDVAARADWPAILKVADERLPVILAWKDGRPTLQGQEPAFTQAVVRMATDRLKGFAGMFKRENLEVKGVRFHLPEAGISAALAVDVRVGAGKLVLQFNDAGIHVRGLPELLAGAYSNLLGKDWPVHVRRVQSIDQMLEVDADFLLGDQRLVSIDGARFAQGRWVDAGTVRVRSDLFERWSHDLKLGKPGFGVRVARLRLGENLRPVGDIEITTPLLREPLVLADVALTSAGIADFGRLNDAALRILRERAEKGLTGDAGPWRATLRPNAGDDLTAFDVTLAWPSQGVEVRFPEAHVDLSNGIRPGTATWKADALTELRDKLARDMASILSRGQPNANLVVEVSNLRVEAENLENVKVLFDAKVTVGKQAIAIPNVELSRSGLVFRSPPDLLALLSEVAAPSLRDLARWAEGKTVDLGPSLRLTVSKVDPVARRVTVAVSLLGASAGEADLEWTTAPEPTVRWRDTGALVRRLRAIGEPLLAGLSDERLRVISARLGSDHIELEIAIKPEPLTDEFLPPITLRLGGDGVRFTISADEVERRIWDELARRLDQKRFRPAGLPVELRITEAKAEATAVILTARADIDGVGSASLGGIRVDRRGVQVNPDAVLMMLADVVAKKLKEALPEGVVALKSTEVKNNELHLGLTIRLRLGEPIDLLLRIDASGRVHGLDGRLLAATAFNQLAAQLKGRKIDLPGGGRLTVTRAALTPNAEGITLDGDAVLYDPFGARITNLVFRGKDFDTSNVTVEPLGVEKILGKLGVGSVGDKFSVKNIAPVIDAGGLRGVRADVGFEVSNLFSVKIGLQLTSNEGVKIRLPIGLDCGTRLPIPPWFVLMNLGGELSDEAVLLRGTFAPAPPGTEMLIRYDCGVRIPFKGPMVFRADGDLKLLSFIPLGHQEAVLDFKEKQFTTQSQFRLVGILSIDGNMMCKFDRIEVGIDGRIQAFGANLADAHFRLDKDGFEAHARVSLLLVHADAEMRCRFSTWRETYARASVRFGFDAFGMHVTIAGAKVEATLAPSASLTATILGQDLTIVAVDLSGITIERVIAALFSDHISLTGWKLLAMGRDGQQGGGGEPVHATLLENGTMVASNPDGSVTCLYATPDGAVMMASSRHLDGGGKEVRIVAPQANQMVVEATDAKGKVVGQTRQWLFDNRGPAAAAPVPAADFPSPPDIIRK